MTENDWQTGTEPQKMLQFLRTFGTLSERKARLFAVAACRRIWPLLEDERSRTAVEVAERFADELASEDEREIAGQESHIVVDALMALVPEWETGRWAVDAARAAAEAVCAVEETGWEYNAGWPAVAIYAALAARDRAEETCQCALLRDIFNPFRPPLPVPASVLAWNDGCMRKLATSCYENRELPSGNLDAGRLSVLADALEEAGLSDQEVLGHLREQGTIHYRGCWCVDALLGKW
jgi:hypothetical protein